MDMAADIKRTLVLDVDGTFIRNDLTLEMLLLGLFHHPIKTLIFLLRFWAQKHRLKSSLYGLVGDRINVTHLPFNDAVITLAKDHAAKGGDVILCSGSYHGFIDDMVGRFDFIKEGFGTTETLNLTAERKAEFLKTRYPNGFDYVGNSKDDIPVWRAAQTGYAVNPPRRAKALITQNKTPLRVIDNGTGPLKPALKAMRLHQWAKNLLLFLVPMLIIDRTTAQDGIALLWGFLAMGLLASATYILNDLSDIASDRAHSTKSKRPFASGQLSVMTGFILFILGIVIAGHIAWSINTAFFVVLSGYFALTLTYSLWLKRHAIIDVLTLSNLFLIRVVAGAAIVSEPLSPWLVCLVLSLFLSLSLVKRYAEISKNKPAQDPVMSASLTPAPLIPGRGYSYKDGNLVLSFGVMTLAMTLISFMLYSVIATEPALQSWQALYAVGLVLTFWMMRIWLLAYRGQMNEDPVLFAIKDPISIALGLLVSIVVIAEKLQGLG